jgi:hypothetical protein
VGAATGGGADPEVGVPPRTAVERLLCRAEEWLYDLNARNHWLFRVYDRGNALWARLAFRGVRRIAAGYAVEIEGRPGVRARLRMLTPEDEESFAGLLARFDFAHLPPHPLDRETARRVLRSANHLPFGIFDEREGRLVGYALVRLFFPWRAATGVWTLPADPERGVHSQGLSRAAVRATSEVTRRAGLADYVTVPLDNVPSLRGAEWAGWKVVRTNRRFHVLLHRHSLGEGS